MTLSEGLKALAGRWQGTNRVWLSPNDPVMESQTEAVVSLTALGKFLSLQYTWSVDGELQEGLLVLGQESPQGLVKAAWVDSWHMSDVMMVCEGAVSPEGAVWVRGTYAAPPGPNWGWRITLESQAGNTFRIVMDNISPEGVEMLAVEAVYTPQLLP